MTKLVSIKFNDAEAQRLARALAASGDEGVSTHIKRVYFDALKLNTDVLEDIRQHLARLASGLETLKEKEAAQSDPAMMLSLLCGLYVMVRKSVPENVRAQADQALEIEAIEAYLKGTPP